MVSGADHMPIPGVGKPRSFPLSPNPSPPKPPTPARLESNFLSVILNVGAMPPDRRAETIDFVGSATVIEMDIDRARRPDVLADITNPPSELLGTFDCVLLFGLTIIHSPSRAVEACRLLTKPGGVALFGFAADSHPVRGGMWDPVMRPVWTKIREPLENIGLKGHMWSFDERAIRELFSAWGNYDFEFFADMFYVVARTGSSHYR